jgi:hypothetical protein
MTDHLPPLPDEGIFDGEIRVWTTSQMTAYALQAIKQLRMPLTDEQINQGRKNLPFEPDDAPEPWAFKQGVRFAEAAHGIKEKL